MGITNPSGYEEIRESLLTPLEPEHQGSVCDWVEENVELPTGEITGKVQLRFVPYTREILERYGDKTARHLVLCFATQSAKSTTLICGMLYKIAKDPMDAAWVMGNEDQSRQFNKERLMPTVRLCPQVLDLVPRTAKGVIDKHLWGFRNQHYRSMVLNFIGAGSAINLSSRPRGFLTLDEVDKFYSEIKFDAGTIPLAEERQKTFNFPICVKASSPTMKERMIWQEYLKTDQRKYWVPCPRCGEMIILKFKDQNDKHGLCGLRWWHENEEEAMTDGTWDFEKVRANAYYKCQCCGRMIHNFERDDMLQVGEWRPDNLKAERGRYGYHLSSLYSILGNETSLGNIAIKFLLAKGLRNELQNFVNGWLAEPWDETQIYENKEVGLEVFKPQDIPKEAVTIMSIDKQHNHFWALVRKFARPSKEFPHGQSWLLFADQIWSEAELDELQKEYSVVGDNVTLDMARYPNAAARMIIEHRWSGVWGSPSKHFQWTIDGRRVFRPYSVPQFRDPALGTSQQSRSFIRAPYTLFSKDGILDAVASLRFAEPKIWHCTTNVNPAYAQHLNSRVKRRQINKRTGKAEWVWVELHQRNHLADCESHATVKALQLGLISLPDETEAMSVEN